MYVSSLLCERWLITASFPVRWRVNAFKSLGMTLIIRSVNFCYLNFSEPHGLTLSNQIACSFLSFFRYEKCPIICFPLLSLVNHACNVSHCSQLLSSKYHGAVRLPLPLLLLLLLLLILLPTPPTSSSFLLLLLLLLVLLSIKMGM